MASGDLMGVILAAGKGTRMQPFSERYPKPILPVLGKPLLAHQIEIMRELGIRDIVIVIGHLGHEVVRTLGDGQALGVNIRYVEQGETLGIAHAVSRLESHVDRAFFLFLGDIFFETHDLAQMCSMLGGPSGTAAVLAVKREPDPAAIRRNFVVLTRPDGAVSRLIEKPRHPRTDLKGCGIYLFDTSFFDAVRRTPRTAMRNEYEITDAIQIFVDDGYRVEVAEVIRADLNLSYAKDLLDLNLRMLAHSGLEVWRGKQVQVGEAAQVHQSVLMDDCCIGARARLEHCLVFPGVHVPPGAIEQRAILLPDQQVRFQ